MPAEADQTTSVFISYRRATGFVLAKYIFDMVRDAGHDVFMDVHSLGAGEFERTTLAEIEARDYFLLVLTAGSLNGMTSEGDWLRKELTQAIESERTVIPVLAEGIKFDQQPVREVLHKLPATLQTLSSFNAVRIPEPEYFDSAMERLEAFLRVRPAAAHVGAGKPSTTAAESKSAAQAQSVLREITLPPAASLPETDSTTPWSDLQSLVGKSFVGLEAPTLTESPPGSLSWTMVAAAHAYVLEEATASTFTSPKVVYEASDTRFDVSTAGHTGRKHYRVKALVRGSTGDSPWSNVVSVKPLTPPTFFRREPRQVAPIEPPRLTWSFSEGTLTWTDISDVEQYVLEEGFNIAFTSPRIAYKGSATSWSQSFWTALTSLVLASPPRHYRVKAVGNGVAGHSDWSNVVTIAAAKPFGAPRPKVLRPATHRDLGRLMPAETVQLQETHRTEERIGEEVRDINNRSASTITRSIILSRKWSKTYRIGTEINRTTEGSLGTDTVMTSALARIEYALKTSYDIEVGEENTMEETVTINVPAHTSIRLVLTWRRLWQHGIVQLTDASGSEVEVPFQVAMGVTFDQVVNATRM